MAAPAQAKRRKRTARAREPISKTRGQVERRMRDFEKALQGLLRTVETRATRLEMVARGRVARTLGQAAKQLKRLERAVGPPTRKKAKTNKNKARAPRQRAKEKAEGARLAA